MTLLNRILVVVGILCGLVALVIAAFATGKLDLAVEFAGAGIVALGTALLL